MSAPAETRPDQETWDVDAGVIIGYPVPRRPDQPLILGPHARLRTGTILYHASRIGAHLETGHNVVIREDCQLGDHVSIWSNTVIDYGCHIGNHVKIHTNCYLAQHTTLEDHVFLAPGVTIANDLYPGNPDSAKLMTGPHIETGAQIGVNVTILPYIRIGAGALIGSGSVVTRDIPPGMVAYGNPATPRRHVHDLPDINQRVEGILGTAGREATS
jgi:acetyltransferase-like isoleucine patch superfamily enzyme